MTHRIHQLQPQFPIQRTKQHVKTPKIQFKDVLNEVQDVKVSKHARQRLAERNIEINEQQWRLISEKMSEAKEKGITDSLIVMNQATLLVSTENNTVVTAMDRSEAATRIFTNINGTIMIDE